MPKTTAHTLEIGPSPLPGAGRTDSSASHVIRSRGTARSEQTWDRGAGPFSEKQLARKRARRGRILLSGSVAFLAYYAAFYAAGIYPWRAVVAGTVTAAGLALVGFTIPRASPKPTAAIAVFTAVLLASGAVTSAFLSAGSHCIGFHTIWALPLIYALFFDDEWKGSATVAILGFLGGAAVLVRDGETLAHMAQWASLSIAAGTFALLNGELSRREIVRLLAESEEAQTRLAAADRMASIGLLAAGVAHEINNPLSYIGTNIELVAGSLKREPANATVDMHEALSDALAGYEQVRNIVGTLSRLSRSAGSATAEVDVNRALQDVLRLSRQHLEKTATITFFPGEIGAVPGDGSRLAQVFLNLLVNAAYAVGKRPAGPRVITVKTFLRAPDSVVVEVRDTGTGISRANLTRLFEPFFTSKPEGSGTGLGLALSAQIVAEHHGIIEVRSSEGIGSIFSVVLPRARVLAASA